ncbi:MAG: O-antigen ligase family protein [Candidatus Omnitrophica bacterium]|nr:O-antigen ligase family protein [Candidatus Omnitrophota bacterium]
MSSRFLRGGLYVLAVCLPFSIALVEVSFGVMLFAWAGRLWERRRSRAACWTLPAQLTWPLAAYVVACLLSVAWSTDWRLSLTGLIGKTLEYLGFLVIVADVARDRAVVRRAVMLFGISAVLVCLDGWLQEWTGSDLLRHTMARTGYGRMTGPYRSPNDLATYLMVTLLLAWAAWSQPGRAGRWWRLGGLLLLFITFVRTDSQGAWLGVGAGGLLLVRRLKRAWQPLVVGLLLLLAGAVVVWRHHGLPSYAQAIGHGPEDRWFMWQAGLGMVRDHPWTGVGLNTFMANYLQYWVGGEQMPRYAHNCYLQTAAEVGIPGLLAFLWLLAALLVTWWRRLGDLAPEADRALLVGLSAAALAFLVQSAVDTNFYALRQVVLFWVVAGLATGLAQSAAARPAAIGSS